MELPLARCLEEYSLPPYDSSYLWLGALLGLLALLVMAFALLLARRKRDWLGAQYQALDRRLSAGEPLARPWGLLKSRFSRREWHGLVLTAAALLTLGLLVLFEEIFEGWSDGDTLFLIDQATHCVLTGALQGSMMEVIVLLTHFADVITVTVLSLVLLGILLVRGEKWQALALFLTVAGGQAVVWGLKFLAARDRPAGQLMEAAGDSFPSGHTFTGTVMYGFLLFLAWHWPLRPWLRGLATLLLSLLILAIGISRILLSVHWVSDVLGGIALGLAWLMASLVLARGYVEWSSSRNSG